MSAGTTADALVSMASRAISASSWVSISCRRASSDGCSGKNDVDSLMCEITLSIARTASPSVASPNSVNPCPLSKTLRMTLLSGSVMRMPWRASAIFELPLKVWMARYTDSGSSCGAG